MSIFRSSFWMGKSESLAQDLVGAFVKTIIFAAAAFVIIEYAKHLLEIHEKRRALVHFQNSTVESAISDLQESYAAHYACTASVGRFRDEECLNGLRSMRVALDIQGRFVSGVLGDDANAIDGLASAIDALISSHGSELDSATLAKLSEAANAALRSTIAELAQEIR